MVALNRAPTASCNGQERRVRSAAERIWGTSGTKQRKSAIRKYDDLGTSLRKWGVPDVQIEPPSAQLLYCHRQRHDKDLYFFNNTGADPIVAQVELRGVHGVPELWDPVSGRIVQAAAYLFREDAVRIELYLGEYESVFVVVDPRAAPLAHV